MVLRSIDAGTLRLGGRQEPHLGNNHPDPAGPGPKRVEYTVDPNPDLELREATITVAGNTFYIDQYGAPCIIEFWPESKSFGSAGGEGTILVEAQETCLWKAISNDEWITITAGEVGEGTDEVKYSVDSYGPGTREGTITIMDPDHGEGKEYRVIQSGS
jgi:hypothetical protein